MNGKHAAIDKRFLHTIQAYKTQNSHPSLSSRLLCVKLGRSVFPRTTVVLVIGPLAAMFARVITLMSSMLLP